MATQDIASLETAITQYKLQLSQVDLAINCSTSLENDSLHLLRSEIEELINLTQETLDSVRKQQESTSKNSDDPLADEYALFKAELAADCLSNIDEKTEESIEDDLKMLNGMKCQAPHMHHWGEMSYHNALICGVEPTTNILAMEEIQVRVLFINPTHREMLPCPYFLDGECRFSDEKCHFSHGELVNLSALKEYRDPDFSAVQPGTIILAKSGDNLWYRAIVLSSEENKCAIKFESSGKKCEIDLHNALPLEENQQKSSSESDEESSFEESDPEEEESSVKEFLIHQSLMQTPPSTALGGWEKYTKGVGSRLMAQMGYITGTGLGRNGEGRIEPVEAVILPAGKSLDHCMELKEKCGGDENLFKAERKLKRLQKKEEIKQKQLTEREKNNKNIFDFINSKLGGKKGDISDLRPERFDSKDESKIGSKELQSKSNKNLNLASLQVDQEIKRAETEITRMQESLFRHAAGSSSHKLIESHIQDKQNILNQLRLSESSINQENKRRKDHKKLTVF